MRFSLRKLSRMSRACTRDARFGPMFWLVGLLGLGLVLSASQPISALEPETAIVRLPTKVIPTSYVLDIDTYFQENNFTVDGKVQIDLEIAKATDEIVLHSRGLQITKTYLRAISPGVDDGKVVFADYEPLAKPENNTNNANGIIWTSFYGITSSKQPPTQALHGPNQNEKTSKKPIQSHIHTNTGSGSGNILHENPSTLSEATDSNDDDEDDDVEDDGANKSTPESAPKTARDEGQHSLGPHQTKRSTPSADEDMRSENERTTKTISISQMVVDSKADLLVLKLTGKLLPGKLYRLYVKYSSHLANDLTGYYKISYKQANTNRIRWSSATVFEPAEARRAFPCFDEPSFKATFQINMGRPKGMNSLSNTNIVKRLSVVGREDREIDVYEVTPPMSTYLVAFYVGNLEARENHVPNEKPFRVWTRPEIPHKQASFALENGPKLLKYLERYLGVKNILNKTDILALPSFVSDALENWGLISFHEKYILHSASSSLRQQTHVAAVLAHELAHTWFGNLVTLDWWPAIWLNEGFATYFGILAVDHLHPDWQIRSTQAVQVSLKILSVDAHYSSHALIASATNKRELASLFDITTYYKGYYILRMIHNTIGEESFRNGVSQYLRKHLYGNVGENDAWDVLSERSHKDGTLPLEMELREVMKTWTIAPGYPLVTVIRDYASGTADLIQARFLFDKDDMDSREDAGKDSQDTSWWIPLTYTSQTHLNFNSTLPKLWLDPDNLITQINGSEVPTSDNWILFNINAVGMYRVNYDLRNWELLTKYLHSSNYMLISPLNRAKLIDDVLDLARSGDVPYASALSLSTYLSRETHYVPWTAAFANFEYLQKRLVATNSSDKWKTCVRELTTPLFLELGFVERSADTALDTLNREQAVRWACATGVKSCVRQAVLLFKRWAGMDRTTDVQNPIPSNLRAAVYCTAIEHGGEEEWVFLWGQYLNASSRFERSTILAALGCTKRKDILQRYLEMSIERGVGIRKQDATYVIRAVISNRLGLNMSKSFLMENFQQLQALMGERRIDSLAVLLELLASTMNTRSHLDEMAEFETEIAAKSIFVGKSMEIAKEKLKFNINWIMTNYDPVTEWLNTHQC